MQMRTGQQTIAASQPPLADGAAPSQVRAWHQRHRMTLVNALIGFTTVLAVVGLFAVWANRQLFHPDNWSKTSTQLLQDASIRDATANYVVDQLYANTDVAGLIKAGLPPAFQQLAGPVSGALRNAAVQGTELALSRPRVQAAWAKANRAADQALVTIVDGGKGAIEVNGGQVTLDLTTMVDEIAARLGLPSNLGSKLPPSASHLKIFDSKQLKFIQNAGNAIRGLALWLVIIVPLLWALALYLARGHRRRALMTIGFSAVLVGVLVLLGRVIMKSQVTSALVSDASLRPAVGAAVLIATGMLAQIAGAFVLVGLVAVAAAWFAGPSRVAVSGRRALAPFLRERAGFSFGFVIAAMVVIFIWQPIPATGVPAGMVAFLGLALLGTELLRRQTNAEFPGPRTGAPASGMPAPEPESP
ncbi:MAG: hypothetical protein JO168_06860 [Solirubrobacterales bacterium]|nr:hypothetical protein [Solirubrobacterales bacterium]